VTKKKITFSTKNTTLRFLQHKMVMRFQQLVQIMTKALTFVFALLSLTEILC